MKLPKIDQLGMQLQKFGVGLQALVQQANSIHQHLAILFAVVRVLKGKEIVTDVEIEEALNKMKEEV